MGNYEDKYFYGTVKVGERGQIVIPKKARDKYDIKPGDSLVILGKDKNEILTIMKEDVMRNFALKILEDLESND